MKPYSVEMTSKEEDLKNGIMRARIGLSPALLSPELVLVLSGVLAEVRRIEEQTGRRPTKAFVHKLPGGFEAMEVDGVEIRAATHIVKEGEMFLSVT